MYRGGVAVAVAEGKSGVGRRSREFGHFGPSAALFSVILVGDCGHREAINRVVNFFTGNPVYR